MPVSQGDTVIVQYIGVLSDGSEFDRSAPDRPLTFKVGGGQVIRGFENAVLGKEKGDKFTAGMAPEMAYGPHDQQLVFPVSRREVPPNLELEPGMALHVSTDQGELEVNVLSLDDDTVYLDANHPLAGKNLTFHIELVDIKRDPTKD